MNKEHQWILEEKYGGINTKEFDKDIERLKEGEPIDYIIGNKLFLNCTIDLSQKPLIPRQETEFWVEKVIQKIKEGGGVNGEVKCLDLFAGSGCIGISILHNITQSYVDFGEFNKKFIEQIKYNLNLNNIDKKRVKVIKSNVFENIKDKYNYIFANPPYISHEKTKDVQNSVLNFEPHNALFSKENGLFFIKKLLNEAYGFLLQKGILFIEFDSWQKIYIEELLKLSKFKKVNFMKDQYNKWRVVVLYK